MVKNMNEEQLPSVSSWSKVLLHRDVLSRQEFSRASQYRARYEFARDFRDFNIPKSSDQTKESYFVLLKLGLAYSAIEILENLLDRGRRVMVKDEAFAAALGTGEFRKLLSHLRNRANRNGSDNSKYLDKYEKPRPGENLADLVRHSRNVVFHGSITPTSIGLGSSKKRRELVLGLANSSLVACNREFARWAKEIEKQVRD
jgi:hypothetical protein